MKNAIDQAIYLMRCRKFAEAISVLNSRRKNYEDSFDFHYTLGLAFLYAGDTGSASINFNRAREIRIKDPNLLLAQAAIFLRRGETDRAVQYYLDILDFEPQNKDAGRALFFVREHGDYEKICRCIDDGSIEICYPPLGSNPRHIRNLILALVFGALAGCLAVLFWPKNHFAAKGRADLSSLMLTVSENANATEENSDNFKFNLSANEIKSSYNSAAKYFQEFRDNAAQRELNRILNSNATRSIKQKCREMMGYLRAPTFDSLKDNFSYEQVASQPELYLDCYVDWSGRVSNSVQGEDSYACDLLVGYEDMKNVEGIVRVEFDFLPIPQIDSSLPVRVLGKVSVSGGKLILQGRSVYQSVKNAYGE